VFEKKSKNGDENQKLKMKFILEDLKEKALRSIGFFNEEGYLSNGAVLFLDDYEGKKTEVQCSVFSGIHKGSDRVVTINRFNGNIVLTINYIMDFVSQRMNHGI